MDVSKLADWLHAAPSERSVTISAGFTAEKALRIQVMDLDCADATFGTKPEAGDKWDRIGEVIESGVRIIEDIRTSETES